MAHDNKEFNGLTRSIHSERGDLMKKAFFGLLLIVFILAGSINDVYAYTPHYLPGGKNYLAAENFAYEGYTYASQSPFLVKTFTEYTLTVTKTFMDLEGSGISLIMYQDQTELQSISFDLSDMTYLDDGVNEWYTVTFTTSAVTNYLDVAFDDVSDYFDNVGFEGFQLEEGPVFTGYEAYIEGNLVDTSAPYFQEVGTIISYVDAPIALADIQAGLTAYDDIDGDLTADIHVVSDDYTPSQDTLGLYEIVFAVSDSHGNSSEITVEVHVVDVLKPVFSELEPVQAVFPNTYTSDDIRNMLSASDNYDGDLSADIVLVSDGYSANASTVGRYEMVFAVTDSSGNTTSYTQVIDVVDDQSPIISGITSVVVGYDTQLTPEGVQNNLVFTDNYDDLAALEIVLVSDGYSDQHQTPGTYEMVFKATDTSGNETSQTVSIQVVDAIGPVVYFDASIIQTYSNSVMSLPDFTALLVKANELDPNSDYRVTVNYDSYTRNAKNPGVYHVSLNFTSDTGENIDKNLEIRVVEKADDVIHTGEQTTPNTQGFFKENGIILISGGLGLALLLSNVIWVVITRKKS